MSGIEHVIIILKNKIILLIISYIFKSNFKLQLITIL